MIRRKLCYILKDYILEDFKLVDYNYRDIVSEMNNEYDEYVNSALKNISCLENDLLSYIRSSVYKLMNSPDYSTLDMTHYFKNVIDELDDIHNRSLISLSDLARKYLADLEENCISSEIMSVFKFNKFMYNSIKVGSCAQTGLTDMIYNIMKYTKRLRKVRIQKENIIRNGLEYTIHCDVYRNFLGDLGSIILGVDVLSLYYSKYVETNVTDNITLDNLITLADSFISGRIRFVDLESYMKDSNYCEYEVIYNDEVPEYLRVYLEEIITYVKLEKVYNKISIPNLKSLDNSDDSLLELPEDIRVQVLQYKCRDWNALANKLGYDQVRCTGDHMIFKNTNKDYSVIIPQRNNIGTGLRYKIFKDLYRGVEFKDENI